MTKAKESLTEVIGEADSWITAPPASSSGQACIVHFWSKSCPACHTNMPHLQKLRDEYGPKGLQVIAVHRPMGEFDLNPEAVRISAEKLGVTEPCALDDDYKIGDALSVEAWPTYFLFDTEGKLRRHARGELGVKMIEQALIRMFGSDEAN